MKWAIISVMFCSIQSLPAQDKAPDAPKLSDPQGTTAPTIEPSKYVPLQPLRAFTLDLTKYTTGDLPGDDLGKNLIIMEEKGAKYLRGRTDDGEVSVKVSLAGVWEATVTVQNPKGGAFGFTATDDQAHTYAFTIDATNNLQFGAEKVHTQFVKAWKSQKPNTITLKADGKTVKCLINDKPFGSLPQEPATFCAKLGITGVTQKTKITELKGKL